MKAKEKPVYESPIVSRLDHKETVIGGEFTSPCSAGSNADGHCIDNGQNAFQECDDGSVVTVID